MNTISEKLYRAFAFGEELDYEWSEEVLAAARRRHVSLDRVIEEAAEEAEARLWRQGPPDEASAHLPRAA